MFDLFSGVVMYVGFLSPRRPLLLAVMVLVAVAVSIITGQSKSSLM